MKKITILLFLVAPVLLMVSSCEKEGATTTKTINVEMNVNETYTAEVPSGDEDDEMQITVQAQHYSVSKLSFDQATGSNLFQYTPALDYVGADEVQITITEEDRHGNKQGRGGGCGNHNDNSTVYIYKISINGHGNTQAKAAIK